MRNLKTVFMIGFALLLSSALLLTYATGCQSQQSGAGHASANPIDQMMAPESKKAGAELWAENCNRCHNARPPQYYSDAQWDTIVHHMRLRADLTGEEARAIAEFLKASN